MAEESGDVVIGGRGAFDPGDDARRVFGLVRLEDPVSDPRENDSTKSIGRGDGGSQSRECTERKSDDDARLHGQSFKKIRRQIGICGGIVGLFGRAVPEEVDTGNRMADISEDLVDAGSLPSVAVRAAPTVNQNERFRDHGRLA